jgi:hypothetical protein
MDHREFRAFVQNMRQLFIDKHRSDYKVGAALARIRADSLWQRWPRDDQQEPGYANFAEFCDRELGYSLSQANQKAANYEKLQTIGLAEDSDTFSRCMRLGWSKLSVVLRVAHDEAGLVAWLNDIEGRNLSEMALRARIEHARRLHEERQGRAAQAPAATPSRRRASADDEDADEDETPPAPVSLTPPRRATTQGYVGYEVRFESQAALDAFTRAVDLIRRRYGEVGMGRAIEMMAVQYMATVPTTNQGGAAVEVENLIRTIESAYGIKLQVVEAARRRQRSMDGPR